MSRPSDEARLLAGIYWMIRGVILSSVIAGIAIIASTVSGSEELLAVIGVLALIVFIFYMVRASEVADASTIQPRSASETLEYQEANDSEAGPSDGADRPDRLTERQKPDDDWTGALH